MKHKSTNIQLEEIEGAINGVFKNVTSKVSKRNIDTPIKVNFSSRIDFLAEEGVRIEEIEHIKNIESTKKRTLDSHELKLNKMFDNIRLTGKQRDD
jgi:uncharacterized protein YajQ (UPF0234 family)